MTDQSLDETLLTTGVASPFLPGTKIQYCWDSTSLGWLKTCPRLYQYIMIDGWSGGEESPHLRFGIEFHAALELFDRLMAQGSSRRDALNATLGATLQCIRDWSPDRESKAGHYKNPESLIGLIIDYLDNFSDDPCKTYIKADGTPAVELSFRFELDWGPASWECFPGNADDTERLDITPGQPYLLSGHLDRVVDFNDQLLVMDRKTTTTTLGAYYFNKYEPNNQMSLYILAGRILLQAPIRGVIIDAAQIKLTEPNAFARGFTYRTEDQLEEWLSDLHSLLTMNEIYAENNYWPMNDTACDNYGGCRFREICSKSPSVREKFLAAKYTKLPESERWNPLKPR
ncbi:MAG: PD-(D/E)XK nuclease family protein [Anaerolineaceae bacterium]|nr:PD-(D/E)XK nuclease family protein [Anaerolineaceae bacterium]